MRDPGSGPALAGGLSLAVLALGIAAVANGYVSAERTLHYWDEASFHSMTLHKAIAIREEPPLSLGKAFEALRELRRSTARNYSDFCTLPLVPPVLAFGPSRNVYIVALALAYQLPFVIIVGALARKLVPASPKTAFWAGVFSALCLPATWLPTLRGFPDTGAAALVGLAALAYLHDVRLGHWWQLVAIGGSIAMAILLRRHFAYAGVAFFGSLVLHRVLAHTAGRERPARRSLRPPAVELLRIAMTVGASLVALAVAGWPFVSRTLTTSFKELYASYEMPVNVTLADFLAYYGWIPLGLSAVGFALNSRGTTEAASATHLVALLLGSSGLLWVFYVKQIGMQYALHFTPWIALGLAAAAGLASRIDSVPRRVTLFAIVGSCLAANAVGALSPVDPLSLIPLRDLGTLARPLFAQRFPPERRPDYDEIARLIGYLRDETSPADPIYVAASSHTISDDLLWHADRALYEQVFEYSADEFWQSRNLNILHWVPFVDSQDAYPLELLVQARYVVVATPFQHHLATEEQDLVGVVVAMFTEGWSFAGDFAPLPGRFTLDNGVTVDVYRRLRPTPLPTALRTLRDMEGFLGSKPGGQQDWMSLGGTRASQIHRKRDSTFEIETSLPEPEGEQTLVYLEGHSAPSVIRGRLRIDEATCPEVTLRPATFTYDSPLTPGPSATLRTGEDFSLPSPEPRGDYLLLVLTRAADAARESGDCRLTLENLSVPVTP